MYDVQYRLGVFNLCVVVRGASPIIIKGAASAVENKNVFVLYFIIIIICMEFV